MNKKLAVLLTCHNRKDKTYSCLKSLHSSSLPENVMFDVFLVDDGSTDGTSNIVKENFPEVNIIQGSGELYWNRGMHLAWSVASSKNDYDFYLWLNDDVELLPNAVNEMLAVCHDGESIVVGNMLQRNENRLTYGGWTASGKLIIPTGNPELCETFNGNLVLIPKKAFKILGNLDPQFPHAIGDFDYALRAKKNGVKSYIAPNYSGICDDHSLPKWCLSEVSLINRIKSLYSPLGNAHPVYYFKFTKRHYGIFNAVKQFVAIHLRLLIPRLWKQKV